MLPFENETFLPGAWTPEREKTRQAVNEWIREGGAFDVDPDQAPGARVPDRALAEAGTCVDEQLCLGKRPDHD